jgi:hypothetical protein
MELLQFTPVPSRTRHDGWSADDQRQFIARLARGYGVEEAARSLGHTRQSVYALRRRKGAEEFAAAWIWAQRIGRDAYEARRGPTRDFILPFETVFVPRFYRGRLVGFVQRQDHMAALRALAELDRHEDESWKLSKLTR